MCIPHIGSKQLLVFFNLKFFLVLIVNVFIHNHDNDYFAM